MNRDYPLIFYCSAAIIQRALRTDCVVYLLGLLVPRFIDTVAFVASATASSSRSDDDAMSGASRRRSNKEIDAVPPPPFGLMGVAGDLCVARRRRCPCIAFSLLLDLASQAPSANITISIKRGTERTARVRLRGPTRKRVPLTRGATHSSRRLRHFVTKTYAYSRLDKAAVGDFAPENYPLWCSGCLEQFLKMCDHRHQKRKSKVGILKKP